MYWTKDSALKTHNIFSFLSLSQKAHLHGQSVEGIISHDYIALHCDSFFSTADRSVFVCCLSSLFSKFRIQKTARGQRRVFLHPMPMRVLRMFNSLLMSAASPLGSFTPPHCLASLPVLAEQTACAASPGATTSLCRRKSQGSPAFKLPTRIFADDRIVRRNSF